MMGHLAGTRRAKGLARSFYALYLVARDPRTPWSAKALIALVVAYAASPIDIIPDFIPGLGHLDDVLLVPLGLWVASRLVPREVWEECQARASESSFRITPSPFVGLVVARLWGIVLVGLGWLVYGVVRHLTS